MTGRRVDRIATRQAAEASPLAELAHRLATAEAEIARLTDELAQTRNQLAESERLADEDALAPVANRRAFMRELRRMVSFSERYKAPSSLLYIDLNDMKVVNDQLGHAAGDAALMQVARLLLANVRNSDVVGRLGGDEFGVLLTQADQEAAAEKALALATVIESTPFVWQGQPTTLRISCGAHTVAPGEDAEAVMSGADAAMYRQKRAGKVGRA